MNWEILAAVGQLAAVLVGVPSLIYLAIQIREQTKERRQAAVNALTVQWGDLTKALHDSAEFSAIYLRGVQSFVFLPPGRHAQSFIMGRDRADDERYDCLPGHTPVVGNAETLALGRVWPRRGRNYCEGQ